MPLAIHAFALDEHLSICFTDRCDEDLFWSSDGAEAQVEVWVFVLASNGCSLFFLLVRVSEVTVTPSSHPDTSHSLHAGWLQLG